MRPTLKRPELFPRRIYLLLVIILSLALIVLVGVYIALRQSGDEQSPPDASTQPGTPVFSFAVAAPAGQPFRPRGAVIVGTRVYVADSEGGRLGVVDLARGPDATLDFIPIAFDRPDQELPAKPQPVGIGVLRDASLLVTDPANGRLWRMGQDGRLLGDFPDQDERARSGLVRPVGVAVAEDEVYVTDVGDQRIKVYTDTGRFLRSVGGPGYLPGELAFPNGIAVNADGEIWVADSNNRRVQLLGPQGEPLLIIDQAGEDVRFDLPRAVALDRLGRVHVIDTFGQTVHIFQSDGRYDSSYGQPTDPGGRLDLPEGLAIDDSRIVVSDGGNRRLVVYTY